jgi:hypothetical protein
MSLQICPVCDVQIMNGTQVMFKHGKNPCTREVLKARVCQYAKNPEGCINKSTILDVSKGYIDDRISMEKALKWAKEL